MPTPIPLVIYVQSVLGLSPTKAGPLTAPMSLLSGIVAPFIGRLSDWMNGKYILMLGLTAPASGLGTVPLTAEPATIPLALVPGLLVCGIGADCIFSPTANLATRTIEPRLIGTASGIFNTARQVGGVLGSAAVGVLLQARLTGEHHRPARRGQRP